MNFVTDAIIVAKIVPLYIGVQVGIVYYMMYLCPSFPWIKWLVKPDGLNNTYHGDGRHNGSHVYLIEE